MPIPHRPPATGNLRYRDPASQCARIIDNQTLSIEFRIESSAEYYFCVPQYPLLLSIWRYGFLAEYPSLGDRARSGPTALLDAILLIACMRCAQSRVHPAAMVLPGCRTLLLIGMPEVSELACVLPRATKL